MGRVAPPARSGYPDAMLSDHDHLTIKRAQQVADLKTPEAVKDYTGREDDFRACAAALAEAQELLTELAAIALKGEVLPTPHRLT
jgi:hypothetical protein